MQQPLAARRPGAQAQLALQRSPARDSRALHPTPQRLLVRTRAARSLPTHSPHNAHERVRAAHTLAEGARPGKFHTRGSSTPMRPLLCPRPLTLSPHPSGLCGNKMAATMPRGWFCLSKALGWWSRQVGRDRVGRILEAGGGPQSRGK